MVGRLADCSTLNFIVDTGAAVTLIRNDVWRRLASNQELSPWQGPRLVGVDGSPVESQGSVTVPITIGDTTFQTRVVVASSMSVEAILGLDFLESNRCVVDAGNRILEIPGGRKVDLCQTRIHGRVGAVLMDTAMLPPRSQMEVLLEPECGLEAGSWLLEPDMEGKVPVCVARAVVNMAGGRFPVRLLNLDSRPTMIWKGTKIATMEHVEERGLLVSVLEQSEEPMDLKVSDKKKSLLWETVERSEKNLCESERETVLHSYADVFSSDRLDFGHTTITQHRIDTVTLPPFKSICGGPSCAEGSCSSTGTGHAREGCDPEVV